MSNVNDQWEVVQPLLRGIREHAFFAGRHSRYIIEQARVLPAVPGYETKAEALLADAEAELEIALDLVRQARAKYDSLPAIEEAPILIAAE